MMAGYLQDYSGEDALQRVANNGWGLAPHGLEAFHHQYSLPLLNLILALERPSSISAHANSCLQSVQHSCMEIFGLISMRRRLTC